MLSSTPCLFSRRNGVVFTWTRAEFSFPRWVTTGKCLRQVRIKSIWTVQFVENKTFFQVRRENSFLNPTWQFVFHVFSFHFKFEWPWPVIVDKIVRWHSGSVTQLSDYVLFLERIAQWNGPDKISLQPILPFLAILNNFLLLSALPSA